LDQGGDFFVHQAFLAMVGGVGEAVVEFLELGFGQVEAQVFGALVQGVAAGVFAEDEFAFGDAYGARVDDFVGGLFLEVAVLVDAGFVGEGVAAYDGFIGLGPK